MITTAKATDDDVVELVDNMRYFDQLEAECLRNDKTILELIKQGIEESEYTESFFAIDAYGDKKLLCIYGLNEKPLGGHGSPYGIPWMLGTNELFKTQYRVDVLRRGKRLVDQMSRGYDYLANIVHSQNYQAHKFLEFCGFTIVKEPCSDYIYNDEQFYKFYLMRG